MAKILALGGGALVGIACFLPLLSLSITFGALQTSGNLHATDLTSGKVALVLAFASLLLAVIDIRGGDGSYRRPAAACAPVGAASAVYKSWTLDVESEQRRHQLRPRVDGHGHVGRAHRRRRRCRERLHPGLAGRGRAAR